MDIDMDQPEPCPRRQHRSATVDDEDTASKVLTPREFLVWKQRQVELSQHEIMLQMFGTRAAALPSPVDARYASPITGRALVVPGLADAGRGETSQVRSLNRRVSC